MNEIIVNVEQKQGLVTANFEEVKKELYLQMDNYRGVVYTEDTAKTAKEDIATLRKVRKAIDEKRKEVKKAQMIPYEEFEEKAKELIQIIDDVINPINEQITVFEENRKKERLDGIKEYFSKKATDVSKYIQFDDIFTDSMLNVSTTAKAIKSAFDSAIDEVKKDIETIKSMKSEIEDKVLAKYAQSKQLSDCVNMITEHEKMKAEILAKQEQEQKLAEEKRIAEEKMRAEIEAKIRAEAEERKLQEAVEKAKEEERRKVEQEMAIQKAKEDEERRIKEEQERIEREKAEEVARIERERILKEENERLEKERIENERLAKIEEEKRIAEEIRLAEERKKNAKYFVKVTGLSKSQLKTLADYLKENDYHFESDIE